MDEYLSVAATLPADGCAGTLVGRVWLPGAPAGPAVVAIRADGVYDLTPLVPTMSELCNAADPVALARSAGAARIGDLAPILANSRWDRRDPGPALAAGAGRPAGTQGGRRHLRPQHARARGRGAGQGRSRQGRRRSATRIEELVGADLRAVKPGSEAAARLKAHLVAQGAWSQYLEVGIGPDAEIFTKSQPMSAVGHGSEAGIHPKSHWNNPEPELVLVVSAAGRIVGATLGNDVNLRDVEGRSALLLGKAKDNNASCALGPFIRLVDDDLRPRRDARRRGRADGHGRGRLHLARHELDGRDQPRHRGAGGARDRPAPRLPRRLRPVLRHDVRAGRRSRRDRAWASPTIPATWWRSPRRRWAPWPTASTTARGSRLGASAPAHLLRNLSERGLI